MKNFIVFLTLFLASFAAFAQKDSTKTTDKVVKIGSNFFIETKTVSVAYQPINAEYLRKIDNFDEDEVRINKEKAERQQHKQLLKSFLKEAIQKGYKPVSDNNQDDVLISRVLTKINQ